MLLFGAFVWMNRNSCDQKLGNTRQDGDQVLCVILLCSYIHKTFKKNVEVLKFSFSRKVSKTKGEEKQHKAKRLKSKKNTRGWENNFCEKKKFFAGDLTREARHVPMVVYLHWPRPARSPAFNWLMKQCVRRYLSVGLDSHEKSHITYKIIPVSHTWTINKSAGVETWLHLSTCRPSLWWLCGRGGSSSPGWTT